MPAPPTLQDVARHAGVSTATVSRCLNTPERVVEETRERVLRAVEELAYTPHFGGRALASRTTDTVGAIIPTMDNAIFAAGVQAFQEELAASGVMLLVASTGYDPLSELAQIKTLVARGADGLLLIGWEHSQAVYEFLEARDVPYVIAWNFRHDHSRVYSGFDNRKAARRMTERVISYGHSRIAMIAGILNGNDRAADRLAGVRDALHAAGLDANPVAVVEARYSLDQGERAMQQILALEQRPTAVVCGNDVLATGALLSAKRGGLRVPDDISITGFDDIELARVVEPQLTTVHVPHRRMGRAAAKLLLALTRTGETVESCEFSTAIVERDSLGPLPS